MLRGFGVTPAVCRSLVTGVALAGAMLLSAPAFAQDAPAQPAAPVLPIDGDAAVISILIKPDKTADFEFVLNKLKDALQKSENPERKKQAAGWKVFKSPQ